MKDLYNFINKELERKYFDIYMILCELCKYENIISFSFKNNIFTVQVNENDYYRINLNEEVKDGKVRS